MKTNNHYMNKLKNKEKEQVVASTPEPIVSQKSVVEEVRRSIDEPIKEEKKQEVASAGTSVIGLDTEIVGTISSKGNIEILGAVKGDVTANGNIFVQGSVEGNLEADSIVSKGGSVHSTTIKVKSDFQVGEDSEIVGNITSGTITVNAKVNGNLEIKDTCSINKDAVVVGDIVAKNLSIQLGASISGHVESKKG